MAYSEAGLNITIANIQVLHARFANDYCNFLKRRTGHSITIDRLTSINNMVGRIIQILYDYTPYGNSTLNDLYNGLTETEMKGIIDYSYRILNKYTYSLFLPDNPNVYL